MGFPKIEDRLFFTVKELCFFYGRDHTKSTDSKALLFAESATV